MFWISILQIFEISTYITVPLNGGANLLWPRGDSELGLALQTFIHGLFGQRSSSAHVLIAGVGAAADQTCRTQVWCLKTKNQAKGGKSKKCIHLQCWIKRADLFLITHFPSETGEIVEGERTRRSIILHLTHHNYILLIPAVAGIGLQSIYTGQQQCKKKIKITWQCSNVS